MRPWRTLGLFTVLLLLLRPEWAAADVIIDWNNVLLDTVRTTPLNPPRTTRAMAMMSAAIYESVNSIAQTHEPYYTNMMADPATSREAAVSQAAHRVLSHLFPANQATYDAALSTSLGSIPDGPNKTAGINLGNSVGDAIIALRANDHSDDVVPYVPGANPGEWVPTPPAFAPALLPQWPTVTPWVMTSGSQFRNPDGPPALDSEEYADNFNEVKEIGAVTSATRTADQSAIAQFWADNPGTFTPPGHWYAIGETVAMSQGNTLEENARMFGLLGLTLADAAIVSWDNKYTYNDWRPVTAIPLADMDGNQATDPQADWSPFIVTPPFPSYTSGHSTFSGAAAALLADFFGTDNISFTSSAEGFTVDDRSFTSFSGAATEAMNSRLYGGIHWRYDNEDGLASGAELGHYVFENQLQAIPEPATATLFVIGFACLAIASRCRQL